MGKHMNMFIETGALINDTFASYSDII